MTSWESHILDSEVMAASNHIVAAIREFGTHQREIPSFLYIYDINGNKQVLLSGSCQALSDWRATFKVSRYLK